MIKFSVCLMTVWLYLGLSGNTLAETPRLLKGNCEELSCEVLWQKLQTNYPEKTNKYLFKCPSENTLNLSVFANKTQSKRVFLSCWEPKIENGERIGTPLGILPFPGYEKPFGVTIFSDDPIIQKRLDQNAEQVEKISFECDTLSGDVNIFLSKDQKVSVQCYFSDGFVLFDSDGDWISDGQYGRGTMIDFSEELQN